MIETKTILGTDAMNQSRITINENFSVCRNAINELSSYFNNGVIGNESTSMTASDINIASGNVTIGSNGIKSTKSFEIDGFVTFNAAENKVTFHSPDSGENDVTFSFSDILALYNLIHPQE